MVYGCISRKDENGVKMMDYEVKGVRRRGRPKKTWTEVVEKTVRSDSYTRQMVLTVIMEEVN